ncbi:MAG: BatA domain-containing protein, partial [Opitutales bacterium]|nr:BatA domain-containing protein [Opitutales bacterium]
MSLLSPWFLAGALLVAGPIIFHLIRRATKDRIQFSAMRFLRESPPKLQKKSRIQNPWLLALRCLIIVLLAFAFARPFFDSDTPFELATNPPKAIVLAIDSSASMQREGAWENAIQRAGSYLEKVDSADKLSIVSVSTNARLLLSFEQWDKWPVNERATLAEALLSETAPNWGATRLDEALELALAELEQIDEGAETATEKTVVLISDMQSTSRIAGVAGREWRDECLLELETIQGAHPGNTGIRWLGWTGDERNRSMRSGAQSSGQALASNLSLALFDAKSNTPLGKTLKLYSNT